LKKKKEAGHRWLTPVIPDTKETEIRRIMVQSQPGQIVPGKLPQEKKKEKKVFDVPTTEELIQ
jgi:hypothetical protein